MPPLSKRAAPGAGAYQSKSLLPELIKLAAAREDTPAAIKSRKPAKGFAAPVAPPVEGAREALMYFLASLPEGAPGVRAARKKGVKAAAAPHGKLKDAQLQDIATKRFDKLLAGKSRRSTKD